MSRHMTLLFLLGITVALVALGVQSDSELTHGAPPALVTLNAGTTTVGVDADPSGNTATSLGTIEACREVNVGDTFDVDIYITDVTDLARFQVDIEYLSGTLTLRSVDAQLFPASGPGSTLSDKSDPTPDADGSYTVAASDSTGPHESGSAALARITLEASAVGMSPIKLASVHLTDSSGAAIGDVDADTVFDGDRFAAEVAVGGPCPETVPNVLLVAFQPGTSAATIDSIISDLGTTVVEFYDPLDMYLLRVVSGQTVGETVRLFRQEPEVELAQALSRAKELVDHQKYPNDPAFQDSEQWSHLNVGQFIAPDWFTPGTGRQQGIIDADADAPQGWDLNTNCRRLGADESPLIPFRIGIIDDGVDLGHPDLSANIDTVWNDEFAGGAVVPGGSVQHDAGDTHGTYVASTIAAQGNNGADISGVCWQAALVIAKDSAMDSFVAAATHLAGVPNLKVVNYSAGGVFDPADRAAIQLLATNDILFVTSAGNDGNNVDSFGGGEGIYRDTVNAAANEIEAGDTRVTGSVVNGVPLPPGTVQAGDGDININGGGADLVPFAATERFVDLDGGTLYDEGEPIVRDVDGNAAISAGDIRYTPVSAGAAQLPPWPDADEDGTGVGTCSDGLDNGGGDGADLADPDCQVQAADADVGTALVAFPADFKHIDNDGDGFMAPQVGMPGGAYMPVRSEDGAGPNTCGDGMDNGLDGDTDANDDDCYLPRTAAFPCSYDLDNIVCVAASDNQDRLAADPMYDPARSEDGAAGANTCIDGIDNGGDGDGDFEDSDCYSLALWSNFGSTSVDLAAPGDDMMLLCNRDPAGPDDDGDTLLDTCDPQSGAFPPPFSPAAGEDGFGPNTCSDGIDNGGDGFFDRNDYSCRFDPINNEDGIATCGDGVDNGGGDGADAVDPDCTPGGPYDPSLDEDGVVGTCNDGLDNGPDGQTDVNDDTCRIRADHDGDGVKDGSDNCRTVPNAGQADGDADGRGDACDPEPGDTNAVDMSRVQIVDGTSFSSPYAAGMAALCWSLMPERTYDEIKNMMLRYVDRKDVVFAGGNQLSSFGGFVKSGGRLKWFCSADYTDEPNSYATVNDEPLLWCNQPPNTGGPVHWDYGNEWFGADVSGEHNANTRDHLDQDVEPNIYEPNAGDPVPPCVAAGPVNLDAFDDGNFVYVPPPPWIVGQVVTVTFDVCSDYFGVADAESAPGVDIGRYAKPAAVGGAVQSDSLIYINAFFDWNANGIYDLPGEHTVSTFVDPTGAVFGFENLLLFPPGTVAPQTPPPTQCTPVEAQFTAQAPFAPWMRWRLDYGEDVGLNDPEPLFKPDDVTGTDPGVTQPRPVFLPWDIAEFGETEDYPFRSVKVMKLDDYYFEPLSDWTITLFDGPGCTGNALTGTTGAQGLLEFGGLVEGSYSVQETLQPPYINDSPLCQDVDLTGSILPPPPTFTTFPAGGTDVFNSGARISFEIAGMRDAVTLNGTTEVARGDPGDSDSDGLADIETEIISMQLVGVSESLGIPITVTESPSLQSQGLIEEQLAGDGFPADSFFDVFVEITADIAGEPMTLHNAQPVTMEAIIQEIPPVQIPYFPPVTVEVPLLDVGDTPQGFIRHALHIPMRSDEIFVLFSNVTIEEDYFPNSEAEVTITVPLVGTDTVTLTGPTTVEVDFATLRDADENTREEVQTEIVQMDLTGTSALLGPVTVRLRDPSNDPFQPSLGKIEETTNGTDGVLDLPPFTETGTADSFFDVFFEVEVLDLGLILHNHDPKHMETVITHKPPAEDETYEDLTVIPLFDVDDASTGVEVAATFHIPNPHVGCLAGDDTDSDGFLDEVEWYLGTDCLDACPNDLTHDAWPLDLNMDTYVTVVGDVLTYRGNVGKDVETYPEIQRLDLNMDAYISVVGDVLVFRGMIGQTCT